MLFEISILVCAFMPLEIDAIQSSIDGSFQQSIHMQGTLIGDYDAKTYPEGTMTRPGLWGGSGNQPIDCTIEPVFGGSFEDVIQGGLDIEIDTDNDLMIMNSMELHAFEESVAPFPLSVIFEYETFRSIAPDSLFVGGFPIEIPFGEGLITAFDVNLAISTEVILIPAGENSWSFQASLPVIATIELEILGTGSGPIPAPSILFLEGNVLRDGNGVSLTATSSWKSQDSIPDPPFFFDNLPLELPTIVPPGDFAGVLLSVAADEAVSSVVANLQFAASGETNTNPSDVNGDGVVNVSDLLAIISVWGECGGCPEDVNSDGSVNVTDLLQVIANWG